MGPADGTGGPAPGRLPAPDTARSRPSAASGRTAPPVATLGLALPAGGSGPGASAAEVSGRAAALLRPPGVGGWTRAGLGAGSRLGNARRGSGRPGELVIPGLSVPVVEGSGPPTARDVVQAGITRPRPCPWRGRVPRWGGSRGRAVSTWTNKETSGSGRCQEA